MAPSLGMPEERVAGDPGPEGWAGARGRVGRNPSRWLKRRIGAAYKRSVASPLLISFAAGASGPWRIDRFEAVRGAGLPRAERLSVIEGVGAHPPRRTDWILRGTTSNTRYTTRSEVDALAASQAGLGRPEATLAALIPIRKTDAWWAMAQDERRAIFAERSRHIEIGLDYIPAIARRLHHARELGENFDFLTWFEYAPEHADAFDVMLRRLRSTAEWGHVEREVDIRLTLAGNPSLDARPGPG